MYFLNVTAVVLCVFLAYVNGIESEFDVDPDTDNQKVNLLNASLPHGNYFIRKYKFISNYAFLI